MMPATRAAIAITTRAIGLADIAALSNHCTASPCLSDNLYRAHDCIVGNKSGLYAEHDCGESGDGRADGDHRCRVLRGEIGNFAEDAHEFVIGR